MILTVAVVAQPAARHLVYSFAYGSQQNISARDSGSLDASDPAGQATHATSGINQYKGSLGDRGTMTVDVQRTQPDNGVVVVISERGAATRVALPAECVVYGNTTVICDPNKTVNPEEYTLLRFLGSNFVNANVLDAHRHWSVAQQNGGTDVQADYTIQADTGGILTIGEERRLKVPGQRDVTTDVQTKIRYDLPHSVPRSIDEYVTQRQDQGATGTLTTIYQTSLQLTSDSSAAP